MWEVGGNIKSTIFLPKSFWIRFSKVKFDWNESKKSLWYSIWLQKQDLRFVRFLEKNLIKYFWERRVGAHSLEKLGANSFYYQRVRAERNSKNLGALNTLELSVLYANVCIFVNWYKYTIYLHSTALWQSNECLFRL